MAYATQVTISTGNKVSLNYQSQEVSVTLTYQLEREDVDVLAIVKEKAGELAQAHRTAWQTLRDAKVSAVNEPAPEKPDPVMESPPSNIETTKIMAQTMEKPLTEPSQTSEVSPELPVSAPRITPGQLAALLLLLTEARWSEQRRHDYLRQRFSRDSVDELSAEQAKEWLLELQRAEREAAQQRRLENAHRNGSHNGTP